MGVCVIFKPARCQRVLRSLYFQTGAVSARWSNYLSLPLETRICDILFRPSRWHPAANAPKPNPVANATPQYRERFRPPLPLPL